ncbi:MAG: NAD(P)H-dependent oxidoreductase [Bacteroidota bacterium]
MTTIISGTNRPGSRTVNVARYLHNYLQEQGAEVQLLDLAELSGNYFGADMYSADQQHPELRQIQERYINGADRFIFVSPEYNGSYPGILKLFIDGISIYRYAENFKGKWSALVGVATGRAGNLRGIDQLSASLLHMGGHIIPGVLPLSKADQIMDNQGEITDGGTRESLNKLAERTIQL